MPRRERPLNWDEVLRRNSVERYKQQKHGYDVLADIPRFAEIPYESIPEEDILRLQWWGLYHDKPKVGDFMLRVKIPNGVLTAAKLRTIGEVSVRHGAGSGELTTRQDVQIHYLRLAAITEIFATLASAGMTTAGGCGDNLRNITGCPVAGIDPQEIFDVTPTIAEFAAFFYGNREYGNLPRKHKHTIAACPFHCNGPEIHDVAWIGVRQDGREGFALWVGGGQSSVPRIGRSLGVFVPRENALEVGRGLIDIWSGDLRYRMSRAKARFKFMVDDDGPEKIRERLEAHLGRPLERLEKNPVPIGRTAHLGVHEQRQPGLRYVGFPCFPGIVSGEQMIAIANVIEPFGGEFRITREQNFVVTGVPEAQTEELIARIGEIGFPLRVNAIRGNSIGCTGDPHCNFAVGDTKPKLIEIVGRLEARFGEEISDLRLYLDGCPHACGQHWVGDLGFQGTTRTTDSGKQRAYDVIVRGGLGAEAQIGRPLLRRIPEPEVCDVVERLIAAWLQTRLEGESIQRFFVRLSDEEIVAIGTGRMATAA